MSIKKGDTVFVTERGAEVRTKIVTAVGKRWVTVDGGSRYYIHASQTGAHYRENGGGLLWPNQTAYAQWKWAAAAQRALNERLPRLVFAQLAAINTVVDLGLGSRLSDRRLLRDPRPSAATTTRKDHTWPHPTCNGSSETASNAEPTPLTDGRQCSSAATTSALSA